MGYGVAMVTFLHHEMTITCLPVIGHLFDAFVWHQLKNSGRIDSSKKKCCQMLETAVSHFKANIFHLDNSTLPDFDCLSQGLPSSGLVPQWRMCLPWHLPHSHLTGTPIENRLSPCSCSNIACVSCQKQTKYNKTRE